MNWSFNEALCEAVTVYAYVRVLQEANVSQVKRVAFSCGGSQARSAVAHRITRVSSQVNLLRDQAGDHNASFSTVPQYRRHSSR